MSEIKEPERNIKGHILAVYDNNTAVVKIAGDTAGTLALTQTIIESICEDNGLDFYDALEVMAKSHYKEQVGD